MSMGNAAGLKALRVLDNAERTLAIELLAGAQAVEFLAPLRPGRGARAPPTTSSATLSERLVEDRSLSADIERVAERGPLRLVRRGGRGRDRSARVSGVTTHDARSRRSAATSRAFARRAAGR